MKYFLKNFASHVLINVELNKIMIYLEVISNVRQSVGTWPKPGIINVKNNPVKFLKVISMKKQTKHMLILKIVLKIPTFAMIVSIIWSTW